MKHYAIRFLRGSCTSERIADIKAMRAAFTDQNGLIVMDLSQAKSICDDLNYNSPDVLAVVTVEQFAAFMFTRATTGVPYARGWEFSEARVHDDAASGPLINFYKG